MGATLILFLGLLGKSLISFSGVISKGFCNFEIERKDFDDDSRGKTLISNFFFLGLTDYLVNFQPSFLFLFL